MKNLRPIFGITILVAMTLGSCSHANMKMVCKPGSKSFACAKFRGDTDEFATGADRKLTATRDVEQADCLITIVSKANREVDIFVDTVWQGMLDSKATGYVNYSGAYHYVHAISRDGQYKWVAEGDCGRKSIFQLSE